MTFYLIGLLAATIAFILVASRLAVHPFLVLLIGAFAFGIGADMSFAYVIRSIGGGFAGTLDAVGLVVVAGSIIGTFVERSGGGRNLAAVVLGLFGRSNVPAGMTVLGYGLGITASLEAAFMLIMPLTRAAARAAGGFIAAGAVALALGLVATHGMVPPAPGPVTAAAILAADLWLVLCWGMGIAAIAAATGWFYAVTVARRFCGGAGEAEGTPPSTTAVDRPSAWRASLPIVLPIALLVVGSIGQFPSESLGGGPVRELLMSAGRPTAVLLAGLVLCLALPKRPEWTMMSEAGWVGQAIRDVAATLLIVGAGGSFAKVLQNSGIGISVAEWIATAHLGLFVPFVIAAVMKTAQGSTMVAIITAAGFTQPLLPGLGLDGETTRALAVVAIGAGAMVVSHANDSLFWIVTRSCGLTPAQGYRLLTFGTLAQGGAAAIGLLVIHAAVL